MTKKKEEIYLIDGSSYIYRAYHTTGGLSNSKGFPTGAVFGFANMLAKTLREKSPDRIAVVFDARGPTFRHELYTEYKANRPPMPDDLAVQIPKIHELAEAYSLPVLSVPGYEADDVIATVSSEARERGWKVVIVSGDKDLMQLVEQDIVMWDPQRDTLYDTEGVVKKFGVQPRQVGDLLALMGDSSDNIPGVPGVGQKTAAKLLEDFGSIDRMYEEIDNITQKRARESLKKNEDTARLSRELVTLKTNAPLQADLNDLAQGSENTEKLRELFTDLEFNRFLTELPPKKSLDFSRYETITTEDDLDRWIDDLRQKGRFAVDLETTSTEPVRAELVGISLCAEDGHACYIPVGHTRGAQLSKGLVLEKIKPVLEDESLEKIGQNIKYDLIVLLKEGIEVKGISCDTMLSSYVLDPSRRSHSLAELSRSFLNHEMIPIKDLIGSGKSQIPFSETDIDKGAEYACEDADVTFRLGKLLCPQVEEEGLGKLFREIELRLVPILGRMELAGVRVDVQYLWELSRELGQTIEKTEAEIYELAGSIFNINSPKQLGEILFVKLGLQPVKKTKTGPSTSIDVLEKLALEHPLPQKILDYRGIFKLKSTYVDSLAELVNPITGRIHTSFNQAVAATGRLSSSDPNLQNIPIRSAEGRKIRRAFIPADGCVFVAADYSQIELRMMAHLSGDKRLKEAFAAGEDIHAITAAGVFECSPAHVTPEMRRKAKEINFGIIYGMGAFRLASQIGVGMKMAQKYLEDYYSLYSGVREYMDEIPKKAAADGFVTTILGRKRYLPDLNSPNKVSRQAAQRVAINTTMQGSAADLIKLAMIRADETIRREGLPAKMILQVHDELILEVEEESAEEALAMIKHEMENVYELSVPLLVEAAIGNNWEEAH